MEKEAAHHRPITFTQTILMVMCIFILCLYTQRQSLDREKERLTPPAFASQNSLSTLAQYNDSSEKSKISDLQLEANDGKECMPDFGSCMPRIWDSNPLSCVPQHSYSAQHETTHDQNSPRCLCSRDILREYYKKCDALPHLGTWQFEGKRPVTFLPQLCKLGINDPALTQKCLQRLKVHKIVTLGDSNGARYFLALTRMFNTSFNGSCIQTRLEHKDFSNMPNVTYFTHGIRLNRSMMCSKRRECSTCGSRTVICKSMGQTTLEIEHLAMNFLRDTTLTLCRPQEGMQSTDTAQEYYFKHYLSGNQPQILIINPPFAHERGDMKQITNDFHHFFTLVKERYAGKSKVIWLPYSTRWREEDQHEVLDVTLYESNQMMFHRIKNALLEEGSTQYGHFDLNAISCPLRKWKQDKSHFAPIWYDVIGTQLLSLLCQ